MIYPLTLGCTIVSRFYRLSLVFKQKELSYLWYCGFCHRNQRFPSMYICDIVVYHRPGYVRSAMAVQYQLYGKHYCLANARSLLHHCPVHLSATSFHTAGNRTRFVIITGLTGCILHIEHSLSSLCCYWTNQKLHPARLEQFPWRSNGIKLFSYLNTRMVHVTNIIIILIVIRVICFVWLLHLYNR